MTKYGETNNFTVLDFVREIEKYLGRRLDPVIIEKGSLLKNGTYLEGPVYIGKNCQIGPNCYLRPFTTIGDNCLIGNGTEIKNSIIGENSKIPHLNYEGEKIDTQRKKFGAVLGDNNVKIKISFREFPMFPLVQC